MRRIFVIYWTCSLFAIVKCKIRATEVDVVVDRCCEYGRNNTATYCHNLIIPLEITKDLHDLCSLNIRYCCKQHRENLNCIEGKIWAKSNPNCNLVNLSEMSKNCCNACKLGQQIAESGGKCNRLQLDCLVDQVKNDCCAEKESPLEEIFEADNDAEGSDHMENFCFEHECSHKCVMINGLQKCLCREGLELAADGKTCRSIGKWSKEKETAPAFFVARKVCEIGWHMDNFGDCVDINECSQSIYPCKRDENCINTHGSYSCEIMNCTLGFKFDKDANSCVDIDECATYIRCPSNKECVNIQGSFECREKSCKVGYQLNPKTGECEDFDECMRINIHTNPCGENAICVNFRGGFECECVQGFKKHFSGDRKCYDINECLDQPGICEHDCSNTVGGFKCSCRKGFQLNSDQKTCKLIKKCKKGSCQGSCKNIIGGFKCGCPGGFHTLGSRSCADINECKIGRSPCDNDTEHCVNTYGSSKCLKKTCDSGYKLNRSKRSCHLEKRSSCYGKFGSAHGNNCQIAVDYNLGYGHIRSNCSIPAGGRGLHYFSVDTNEKFEAKINFVKIAQIGRNVKQADASSFSVEKSGKNVIVRVVKSLDGPQEIELDIMIHVFGNHGKAEEFFGHRMFIVVSGQLF